MTPLWSAGEGRMGGAKVTIVLNLVAEIQRQRIYIPKHHGGT
jgi:hypothetical protein